jgi:hypothetical protein
VSHFIKLIQSKASGGASFWVTINRHQERRP